MGASGPLQGSRAYPGKGAIRRVVETARDLNLDVAAFSVAPDGTITVMEARAMPQPGGLFDRLEAEGKL
ncbi:MAG: hypothetical protein QOH86_2252 [Sphingomonadales bacterium]|nr:hypothetical protein [Sphingomonadales bacterium]